MARSIQCRACGDVCEPARAWNPPPSDKYSQDEYCKDCYLELVTGEIPPGMTDTKGPVVKKRADDANRR